MATIGYKAVKIAKPGEKGGKNFKYYARVSGTRTADTETVAKWISRETHLSSTTVKAVLDAYYEIVVDFCEIGMNVQMGDLGTFHVTLSSEGVDDPYKLTVHKIKAKRIKFALKPKLKRAISFLHVRKIEGSNPPVLKDTEIDSHMQKKLDERKGIDPAI